MIEINDEIAKEIEKRNNTIEKENFSEYASFSKDAMREKKTSKSKYCTNYSYDTDKIINSKAYTRYMKKTQVFSHAQNDLITTRALHVQLVSKIARKIGRALSLNEDLIEAISLAHDLGHTPYGHEGEAALNKVAREYGRYFRHSAQSVRLLRELGNLNVSIQVLDGILCHNGEMVQQKYKPKSKTTEDVIEEYEKCFIDAGIEKKLVPMTLEGCVVRISDLIAYLGRDIEDAILLNVIKRSDIPKEVKEVLGDNNKSMVDTLVADIINNSYNKGELAFSKECFEAINRIKSFNYEKIYLNPIIKIDSMKREQMFGIMFEKYLKDLEKKYKDTAVYKFVQSNSKYYIENTSDELKVIDFIAGMTDEFFKREYEDYLMPKEIGISFNK